MGRFLGAPMQHGYWILFAIVFLESIAIPVPAAIALLVAGGAAAHGSLGFTLALGSAFAAMTLGDSLMFLLGRYTGWGLLSLLCRLSLNPESCVLSSADAFYRRGRILLLFAKFVPGINTMAPPLAGSMNMPLAQFLKLDLVGALLYVSAYLTVGFLFSGMLNVITDGYQVFGRALGWIVGMAAVGYLAFRLWRLRRARALHSVPFVPAAEAARALSSGDAVMYDVRSHGYYDRKSMRIQGSTRLEPNAIYQLKEAIPRGTQVILYCTCVHEATSVRVAQMLQVEGVNCAVLKGGLRAWKKAGLPLEPVPADEMAILPVFAA